MKNILLWLIVFLKLFLHESFGFENLAVRKTAHQSSTYLNNSAYGANLAVDDILSQAWPTAATKFQRDVYWYVDLGGLRNVLNVTIYYRTDSHPPSSSGYKFYSSRFAGFSLYISTKDYKRKGGHDCRVNSTSPPLLYSIPCAAVGQYVTIYNHRDNNQAILELAEVQVFGCPNATTYNLDCDMQCSNRCRNSLCDVLNGSCFACVDGYQGNICDEPCSNGQYGENCMNNCNINCVNPMLCDNVMGNCTGGCKPGWTDGKCNQSCEYNKYGQDCREECGNCQTQPCDKVNGSCAECLIGFYPPLCNLKCDAGFYGQDCFENCSWNCQNNETCNYDNGYCPHGCADGWTSPDCSKKCPAGYYGRNCSMICNENCKNSSACHHVTGTCENGCKGGFYGLKCTEVCSRNCKNNSVCDGVTGTCTGGCAKGWKTEKCNKQCDPGEYGENCTFQCGNCKNDTVCDIRSGQCEFGCGPGVTGILCKKVCSDGLYGEDCSNNCSGNCVNSDPCNVTTGVCDGGCVDGYSDNKCFKKCGDRHYGTNCEEICSVNCFGNETCHFVNGSCPRGCVKGWTTDTCTEKEKSIYTPTAEESNAGPIIGGIFGALIGVVVAVVIFIIRRRKREKDFSSLDKELKQTSNISTDQIERTFADEYHEEGHASENATGFKTNLNNRNNSPEENKEVDTYYNTASKPEEVYKDIKIEDLHNFIQDNLKNEKAAFVAQYEGMFKGEEYPCDEGKKQENISKNRFKTTFPYDHSRVILRPTTKQTSDYINANYIENIEGERIYIAAQGNGDLRLKTAGDDVHEQWKNQTRSQNSVKFIKPVRKNVTDSTGPKPNTLVDFWKMVWQENVKKIVMVTNLKEGAKIKCEKYWPDTGETLKKGDVIIKLHEERHYAFYTIRTLKIIKNVTKEDRLLYHFHYTQWMDHDVPDSLGLVIFHRHVMRTSVQPNLTIVHCSAGIGRTGTFIALDALYRNGKKTGKVNVPAYVRVMRKDRMSMIQNVNQYITVFSALEEAFRSAPHAIPRDRFVEEVENQNKPDKPANSKHIRTTFHELRSLKPQYTKNECQAGRDNPDANYTKSVIPVDRFRCSLFSYSKGRGNYYNAVFMQSYTKKDGFISAQFPLLAYTEDFLRLVYDFESHIVVSVNPLSQIESTSSWMPINKSGLTIGNFKVSLDSQPQTTGSVKSTTLSLIKEGLDRHSLEVFESTSWNTRDALPTNTTPVLELVTQVQKALKSHPDNAIVVLSVDGASKCGVFCAVFNALQQVHLDDEVDLFTIVRQLQIRRPEMFSNMDEYQFCFKAVAEHLSEPQEDYDNIYANCE